MTQRQWSRRDVLVAGAGTVCLSALGAARAQSFPEKPIRLIVPFAGGGALDQIARELAKSLTHSFGQPVLVENRPGANAVIGSVQVANSPPDGHTLLVHATAFLLVPNMMQKAPYDPLRDFVPISNLSFVSQVLLVNSSSEVNSLGDLLALAKAKPGLLNYGSGGAGTSAHMAAELLMRDTGIKLNHIPYKGNAPALMDLIGGHLQLVFDNVISALPHVRSGRLRALGVTSVKRSSLLPDVPTIGETVPGYEASIFQGVFAPANTPKDVVAKLHAAIVAFASDPALKAKFGQNDTVLAASTSPEEFAARMASEFDRWSAIVKQARIRID